MNKNMVTLIALGCLAVGGAFGALVVTAMDDTEAVVADAKAKLQKANDEEREKQLDALERDLINEHDAEAKQLGDKIEKLKQDLIDANSGHKVELDSVKGNLEEANETEKRLQDENDELRAKLDEALEELVALTTPLEDLALALKFGSPEAIKALADIKWNEMGSAAHEMRSGIVKFMNSIQESIDKGEAPDMSGWGDVMKPGAKLMPLLTVLNGKVKSFNPSMGPYSHPLNLFNLMASELEAAGKPLSEKQLETFSKIGHDYELSWDQMVGGYSEKTLLVQKLIDEAELKDAHINRALAALDAEQNKIVSDPSIRGRVGLDSYSPGHVFMDSMMGVLGNSREDLEAKIQKEIAKQYGLEESRLAAATFIIKAWVDELETKVQVKIGAEDMWVQWMPELSHLVTCAKTHVKYVDSLLGVIRPNEAELKKIRESSFFLVPRYIETPAAPAGEGG